MTMTEHGDDEIEKDDEVDENDADDDETADLVSKHIYPHSHLTPSWRQQHWQAPDSDANFLISRPKIQSPLDHQRGARIKNFRGQ